MDLISCHVMSPSLVWSALVLLWSALVCSGQGLHLPIVRVLKNTEVHHEERGTRDEVASELMISGIPC